MELNPGELSLNKHLFGILFSLSLDTINSKQKYKAICRQEITFWLITGPEILALGFFLVLYFFFCPRNDRHVKSLGLWWHVVYFESNAPVTKTYPKKLAAS